MVRLLEETPLSGLDVVHGAVRLREMPSITRTWLAPYPGHERAMSHALKVAMGLSWPAPGEALEAGSVRLLWAGRAQAWLLGAEPARAFSAHGAVIDQTEGWVELELSGAGRADVLARLTPLDMAAAGFPEGRTARSLLGHVSALFAAGSEAMEIHVMRSMAHTAASDIEDAMRSVAARG